MLRQPSKLSSNRSLSRARNFSTMGRSLMHILMMLSMLLSFLAPVTVQAASAPRVLDDPVTTPTTPVSTDLATPMPGVTDTVTATLPITSVPDTVVEQPAAVITDGQASQAQAAGTDAESTPIVSPDANGLVQAWDRYAYTNNNPVKYNDPSGHCIPWCTALAGAIAGEVVNYGIQAFNNYQSGMSLGDALTTNIDAKSIAVAAVGGAVAGATMGLASAAVGAIMLPGLAATATEGVIGGAISNIAAGQAEALTSAVIDQVTEHTTLQGDNIVFGTDKFLPDAKTAGFGNWDKMAFDGSVGALVGTVAGLGKLAFSDAADSGLYLGKSKSPFWIRPASTVLDYLAEGTTQKSEDCYP